MNLAMFFVAALALCALPSALSLNCYHCQGNLDTGSLKLCTNMSEYTNQTCMTGNATCGKTELKSNVSEVKAFILGCVEEPHNCTSYESSLCDNATEAAKGVNIYLATCTTECCSEMLCNTAVPPTSPPAESSSTGTGPTVEATTATAQMFRPELIGMLIVLMAVFFGLQ